MRGNARGRLALQTCAQVALQDSLSDQIVANETIRSLKHFQNHVSDPLPHHPHHPIHPHYPSREEP
jgi:hypothetical protein